MATCADRNDEGYKKIASELQRWRKLKTRDDSEAEAEKNEGKATPALPTRVNGPVFYGSVHNSIFSQWILPGVMLSRNKFRSNENNRHCREHV